MISMKTDESNVAGRSGETLGDFVCTALILVAGLVGYAAFGYALMTGGWP